VCSAAGLDNEEALLHARGHPGPSAVAALEPATAASKSTTPQKLYGFFPAMGMYQRDEKRNLPW
jgi:hypothetical protein